MTRIAARLLIAGIAIACTACASTTTTMNAPMTSTTPTPQDLQLIHDLLNTYTTSVSKGQRADFEQLLLDETIPFYGLPGQLPETFAGGLPAVQNYPAFRRSVFESGVQFAQTFWDVQIDQDGDLAQVSLRFQTRRVLSGETGRGWKILHLLKVKGRWKIASEFYTVYR